MRQRPVLAGKLTRQHVLLRLQIEYHPPTQSDKYISWTTINLHSSNLLNFFFYNIMAKSLSNILKGISAFPAACSISFASQSFYCHGMQFSTIVPGDPDTHDDFKPTNKLESSGLSLKDIVEQDVKDNPVMLYMKGEPNLPRCGFSSLAVTELNEYEVPVAARKILEDPKLKDAVKAFSHCPTFPQIFIKGEFIGGSDIILSMDENGKLKEKLKDVAVHEI